MKIQPIKVLNNRDVARLRKRFIKTRNRSIERASTARLLEALPEGPFTTTELQVEIEQLDLSDLADSTGRAYRYALNAFVRFVEEG